MRGALCKAQKLVSVSRTRRARMPRRQCAGVVNGVVRINGVRLLVDQAATEDHFAHFLT